MKNNTPTLITPRRYFQIRVLGFTVAGAPLAVSIVTLPDAEARLARHVKGVEAAMRDLFPAPRVKVADRSIITGCTT